MTSIDLQQRVNHEIGDAVANRYGWNFRPFLLPLPELREYDGDELWTVLIEGGVDGKEGYHVIYDPEWDEFGLATSGVCVSICGSFMNTLNAM